VTTGRPLSRIRTAASVPAGALARKGESFSLHGEDSSSLSSAKKEGKKRWGSAAASLAIRGSPIRGGTKKFRVLSPRGKKET